MKKRKRMTAELKKKIYNDYLNAQTNEDKKACLELYTAICKADKDEFDRLDRFIGHSIAIGVPVSMMLFEAWKWSTMMISEYKDHMTPMSQSARMLMKPFSLKR